LPEHVTVRAGPARFVSCPRRYEPSGRFGQAAIDRKMLVETAL
jgi:hypothetical protein